MIPCKSTEFTPTQKRILLNRDYDEISGLIHLPSPEKSQFCTVVNSGWPEVRRGDRVILGNYKGTDYKFTDGTFTMCFPEHIMAVVE